MELIFQELPLNGSGIRILQSVLGDHFTMSSACVTTTDHTKEPHWESIHSQMFILNLDYLQILDFHKTLFNKKLFSFKLINYNFQNNINHEWKSLTEKMEII
jgi:hypothetical protein